MDLKRAIILLQTPDWATDWGTDPDVREAARLGVEALKLLNEFRTAPGVLHGYRLPGETKE